MIGITQFLNELSIAKDREAYIQKHIMRTYVPIEEKRASCQRIIDMAVYKEVNNRSVFWPDTPLRIQLFTQEIIRLYTDIDLTDGVDLTEDNAALLKGYNKLEAADVISEIIEQFQTDFNKLDIIMKMMIDDAYLNGSSFINWLDTKVEAVGMVVNQITSTIWDQIKDSDEVKEFLELIQAQDKEG